MLTVALPWVLVAAGLAAAGVTVLHLLALERPPVAPFPPARFLSDAPARAAARQRRPHDLPLLCARVTALLAAGAALAGIRWVPSGPRTIRVVVADAASRAARPAWAEVSGDASATVTWVAGLGEDPGRALAAAQRAAAAAVARQPGAATVALEVRLPGRVRDLTSWRAWRPYWPGPVAVRPALGSRWPEAPPAADVMPRVVWPDDGVPVGWTRLSRADRVGAVAGFGVVLVGPWERRAIRGDASEADVPVVWWSDGAVAAVERRRADGGCERVVAIPRPAGTDLLASPAAVTLRRALANGCGGRVVTQVLADSLAAGWAGDVSRLAPASAFVVTSSGDGRPGPPLLAGALWLVVLGALVAEGMLRRAPRRPPPG